MKPLLAYAIAGCAMAQTCTPAVEWDSLRHVTWGDWAASGDPLRPQQWALDAVGELPPPPDRGRVRATLLVINDTGCADWHEDSPDFAAHTVYAGEPWDDLGHGTHVLGIAGALTGNGLGMYGMTASAGQRAASVKCLSGGFGTVATVALGIMIGSSADTNAVVNCSIQGPWSWEIDYAAEWAAKRGAIVVFAAGNSWGGPVSGIASPAPFIVVSSVSEGQQGGPPAISDFSSIGDRVDFCAPGGDVLSNFPFDGMFSRKEVSDYVLLSGTSMAAPHVSGLIVRMRDERPLTRDQVYTALRYTALDLGEPGHDPLYGHGLIRAPEAVDLVRADRSDFDRDGEHTAFDFIAFQEAFTAGEYAADFDLDGDLTYFDMLEYVWEAGL